MENTDSTKTLITKARTESIQAAFAEIRETIKKTIRESVNQDKELLQKFGATLESMQAAGLSGESRDTVVLREKLETLKKAAEQFNANVMMGDVYLEDEIIRERKHNRALWDKWAWDVTDDPFVNGRYKGQAAGLDAVLTIFHRELSPEVQ